MTKHCEIFHSLNSRSINHQQVIGNNVNSGPPLAATNIMNRPASAYFNNSNSSNVMNLSSPSTSNIPNTAQQQSTSTGNLMQANPSNMMGYTNNNMMPSPAQAHISHPNLSGMSNASSSITNSPITAHRPPIMPNKQQQQGNFNRDAQSQHSLRSQQLQQQQMMAPSMPNIPHASGYAATIPASQSMQNVNQVTGNYQMYQLQQQQEPQLSPNQQASLLRGTAKMAEMGEMLKRQQRNQQQQMTTNGPIHYTNSMDNIHIPQTTNSVIPPQMLSPHSQQQRQAFHPQSPQKQLPTTAPKPQVSFVFSHSRITDRIIFLCLFIYENSHGNFKGLDI